MIAMIWGNRNAGERPAPYVGCRTRRMKTSMPTNTWPNHTTLVTGVQPGKHGVIANDYFDREQQKRNQHDAARENTPARVVSTPAGVADEQARLSATQGAADGCAGEAGKYSHGGLQLFRAGDEGSDVSAAAEDDQPGSEPGDALNKEDGQAEFSGDWHADGKEESFHCHLGLQTHGAGNGEE